MNIAVIGYPYTRPNYRAALESLSAYFILPKVWKIKKGKAEYHTAADSRIITTPALFHHSDYPIIGGLLKGWMPMFPWLLWKLKRQHEVQLVFEAHEPILLTTFYHGLAVKILGLKHVVFSWENIPFEKKLSGIGGFLHRCILWANLKLADGVVCGNVKCQAIFTELTRKPLVRIPLAGLDIERFRPPASRLDHVGTSFIFAGAIDRRKGLHVLLSAFQKIYSEDPFSSLTIIGSGTYEQELDRQISKFDLVVKRVPWADQAKLIEEFSKADVFVYPSIAHRGWEEQFGYSMAEASLMGLPIIATSSGSIEEVVKDRTTGLLVEPNNVGQLIWAMKTLAADQNMRQVYGQAGRMFIAENFSNEIVRKRYEVFFDSLLT